MANDFAAMLHTSLTLQEMSGRDLARIVGRRESTVSHWRTGKSLPSADDLARIVAALDWGERTAARARALVAS